MKWVWLFVILMIIGVLAGGYWWFNSRFRDRTYREPKTNTIQVVGRPVFASVQSLLIKEKAGNREILKLEGTITEKTVDLPTEVLIVKVKPDKDPSKIFAVQLGKPNYPTYIRYTLPDKNGRTGRSIKVHELLSLLSPGQKVSVTVDFPLGGLEEFENKLKDYQNTPKPTPFVITYDIMSAITIL